MSKRGLPSGLGIHTVVIDCSPMDGSKEIQSRSLDGYSAENFACG